MKKHYKKSITSLLAIFSMAGTVHADEGTIRVIGQGTATKAMIQQLVEEGYITPFEEENWYQINQLKLDEISGDGGSEDESTKEVLEMLKSIVGKDVNIRYVDAFKARMSSQDYPGIGK